MYDKKTFKETFSALHASGDTLTEVLKMTTGNKKRRKYGKRTAALLIAALFLMALTATALAHSGLLGWIFSDRDEDVRQRSKTAQAVLEDFAKIAPPTAADNPEDSTLTDSPDDPDLQQQAANAAISWFAGLLEQDRWQDMEMSEYASESEEGAVTFYFNPVEQSSPYEETISVAISPDGRIYSIDLRQAIFYPQPENCPEEYLGRGTNMRSGEEFDVFYADLYLKMVAYPDRDAYAVPAEKGALDAMALLLEAGLIDADLQTVDVVYFNCFTGGAAWVDVLMANGDAYRVFLQPDDFRLLGFMLFTPEHLANGNGNAALFDALRNGTLEEYERHQQELYATSVG